MEDGLQCGGLETGWAETPLDDVGCSVDDGGHAQQDRGDPEGEAVVPAYNIRMDFNGCELISNENLLDASGLGQENGLQDYFTNRDQNGSDMQHS